MSEKAEQVLALATTASRKYKGYAAQKLLPFTLKTGNEILQNVTNLEKRDVEMAMNAVKSEELQEGVIASVLGGGTFAGFASVLVPLNSSNPLTPQSIWIMLFGILLLAFTIRFANEKMRTRTLIAILENLKERTL